MLFVTGHHFRLYLKIYKVNFLKMCKIYDFPCGFICLQLKILPNDVSKEILRVRRSAVLFVHFMKFPVVGFLREMSREKAQTAVVYNLVLALRKIVNLVNV